MTDQTIKRPDTLAAVRGLKDFQCNTMEYVTERLFDEEGSGRFLIADEVGLGKTLVARGVIAKTVDHLWDSMDGDEPLRIDIVYICSNADIAKQNINRLRIPGYPHASFATRITLLPSKVSDLLKNRLNFVSFTPGTSFNLRSQMGIWEERVLLYHMLKYYWELSGTGPLNVLRGTMKKDNFRRYVKDYRKKSGMGKSIDKTIESKFHEALDRHIKIEVSESKQTIRDRFNDLCIRFKWARKHIPSRDLSDQRYIIGELRLILATSCITALEPDLIILDEFQRFKHLLRGTGQAGGLAKELFLYPDAKLLLLSATPYKMYTLTDETGVDDHYKDFLLTADFLLNEPTAAEELRNTLDRYRRELYRIGDASGEAPELLFKSKCHLESLLKQVMVRTEKLAATADHSGMLTETTECKDCVRATDLTSYVSLFGVTDLLNQANALEYWKSSPYLLNFMDRYQLKRKLTRALHSENRRTKLAQIFKDDPPLLLSRNAVERYQDVDPNNARLRYLIHDTVHKGSWQLLWVPPSLPYYELSGPFGNPDLFNMTKRLVFSAWQVVPRAVSTLASYEAERCMMASETTPVNTPEARSSRARLLEFGKGARDGRLTGMPVLTMLYPSITLAAECDPLAFFVNKGVEETPPLKEIYRDIKAHVESLLRELPDVVEDDGRSDEAWYWAAPILLDWQLNPDLSKEWWAQTNLAERWKTGDETIRQVTDNEDEVPLWTDHVEFARRLYEGGIKLGRRPDDLADVITQMAIAGPATVSLRSLSRVLGGSNFMSDLDTRLSAGSIGWAFRSLFNVPEIIAMVRGLNREEPYWRRVLEYCLNGCLQATLDEYVHVLRDSLGIITKSEKKSVKELSEVMRSSIQLRPASLGVDDISVDKETEDIRTENGRLPGYRLRTHYAVRFGDQRSDDDRTLSRKEAVREAFNSPFWPFILVTTSVGQEGLDFHWYCHAVVHWNLPPNPVDLEQREGRIHRYKGHAIRKNLAHDFREEPFDDLLPDPWQALFSRRNAQSTTDLVPFWIFPEHGSAIAHIERHVPAVPLSREVTRLESLKRSLTVYRMVFGLNRQEDLVEYILDKVPPEDIPEMVEKLQVNLEPPKLQQCNKPKITESS